jgi:glutamate racemase
MSDPRAIGVFDSGMGGLTVLRALEARLPEERFLYLGDTARLPYGTKSGDTVAAYALQATRLLVSCDVKLIVIACNTASAVALTALMPAFAPTPVIGVVEPGAAAGVAATRNRRIGVLATEGTVRGGAYVRAIHALDAGIEVCQQPCQLFVALAEEGWGEGEIAEAAARAYVTPLFGGPDAPDTLVLGCTHFPVLSAAIARAAAPGVSLVDSAVTAAESVADALLREGLASSGAQGARTRFLATDAPERFARVGGVFLGRRIEADDVELVDLGAA